MQGDLKKTDKKQEKIEKILNHPVQGEAYILTQGRIWKAIVLRYFNKINKGELTIDELVQQLESRYGVKYAQKHSLVRFPVEECLRYISKISNTPLNL